VTPEQIVEAAIQEDVDVIGLSCLSGAHMSLFPKTMELLRKKGPKDLVVVAGGIIPEKDIPQLKEAGIAEVFGPGTSIDTIAKFITTKTGGKAK
jgi:methylmalonyl-CoA mutase C-terminal domain/subunit